MTYTARSPRRYRELRALVLATKPPICAAPDCRQPIDLALRYPHPMSAVVDHNVPVRDAPDRVYDYDNLFPMHKKCNERKGARTQRQSRTW